jgi:hypothetical protein
MWRGVSHIGLKYEIKGLVLVLVVCAKVVLDHISKYMVPLFR